jgi:multiple sugar transport system permease protein
MAQVGSGSKRAQRAVVSVLLWILGAIWFSPVFWMLSTSLKTTTTAIVQRPPRWIPTEVTLENYRILFAAASGINVARGILNSAGVALATIAIVLVVSVPAAYALSRLRFRGRKFLFWSYVGVLAFPGVLFLIPHFLIIKTLGLLDTYAAVILPGIGSTFGVFLLRQYMLGISNDLDDAAWIDGCTRLRFLLTIVVPFIRPALLVLALMTFLGSWNNFLWPLLVLISPNNLTLPIALVRFRAGWGDPFRGIGPLMAGAVLSVLPTLIIFVFFHRYLMRGITIGAVDK